MLKMIQNYFKDRWITYVTAGRATRKRLTAVVPQRSVLGPTMWNVLYDGLLWVTMPEGVTLIAYADDVVITIKARGKGAVEMLLEETAERVVNWLEGIGIELANDKTEAILFSRMKKPENIEVMIRGQVVPCKETVKYLGLHIDRK